ncbi:MAG: pentapeptide repeat-containing protein [Nitrospira defluvii]|nr:pentapeptide repeat-containing protein [Nitrospira defluvii]
MNRHFATSPVTAWLTLGIFLGAVLTPEMLCAECTSETGGTSATAAFTLRLSNTCTEAEREARAIPAQDLLRALASGKGIDLAGVVIHGDLLLDELPAQKMAAVRDLSPEDRRDLEGLNDEAVHVIRGPFVIKNARVQGRIVNRLKQGFLLFTGPVVLAQTRFEGSVDLSRTVFLGLVDGSSATFEQESYFVQDRFTQGAMFSDTRFGPHARFHRSIFAGPAIFRGAAFKGLTEFLEVVFDQDANFSHASFHMGTGFSGVHCRGKCDFSSAQFDREAFFLFALFDRPVTFASARFGSQADFSDASFKERDDLAQATFAHPPLLTRTARVTATTPGRAEASPSSQTLTIALFVMALGLLLYIIRAK